MTDQTETGDIGAGMNRIMLHYFRCIPVKCGHETGSIFRNFFRGKPPLNSGIDNTGAERLGQYQTIFCLEVFFSQEYDPDE